MAAQGVRQRQPEKLLGRVTLSGNRPGTAMKSDLPLRCVFLCRDDLDRGFLEHHDNMGTRAVPGDSEVACEGKVAFLLMPDGLSGPNFPFLRGEHGKRQRLKGPATAQPATNQEHRRRTSRRWSPSNPVDPVHAPKVILGTSGQRCCHLTIQKKSRIRQRKAQPPSSSPAKMAFTADARRNFSRGSMNNSMKGVV